MGTALMPPGLALPLGLCLGATEVLVPDATLVFVVDAFAPELGGAGATPAFPDFPLLTGNCC